MHVCAILGSVSVQTGSPLYKRLAEAHAFFFLSRLDRAMAPKRAPRKRPATADVGRLSASRPRERCCAHSRVRATTPRACAAFWSSRHCEKMIISRLGRPEADRQALYRRAEAAAKNAAAGYETQGDLVIGCMCIGQPHDEEEPIPQLEGCKRHPELWTLPEWPSQIRLAFLWFIAKRGREKVEHESAWSCVVCLNNAERHGVPLPSDFAPEVAAVLEADAKDKGALPADRLCLAGQLCSSDSLTARAANAGQRI